MVQHQPESTESGQENRFIDPCFVDSIMFHHVPCCSLGPCLPLCVRGEMGWHTSSMKSQHTCSRPMLYMIERHVAKVVSGCCGEHHRQSSSPFLSFTQLWDPSYTHSLTPGLMYASWSSFWVMLSLGLSETLLVTLLGLL